jgi:hypothetical protein
VSKGGIPCGPYCSQDAEKCWGYPAFTPAALKALLQPNGKAEGVLAPYPTARQPHASFTERKEEKAEGAA